MTEVATHLISPRRSLSSSSTNKSAEQYRQALGLDEQGGATVHQDRDELLRYLNLQLIANGFPAALNESEKGFADIAKGLLANHQQKNRMLRGSRCPADYRIENFLQTHFDDVEGGESLRLPDRTLALDHYGLARELSLPIDRDEFQNDLVQSYRVKNGVLHNPKHDRRTTKGTFHVTEGGLPIAADKLAVPREAFVKIFQTAMEAPQEMLEFPLTSNLPEKAAGWATLMLRPIVLSLIHI